MYVCHKSFAENSKLSKHNKTTAHIERMKSKDINISPSQSNFIDCGETVKVEDIKEEINEKESVDYPDLGTYVTLVGCWSVVGWSLVP